MARKKTRKIGFRSLRVVACCNSCCGYQTYRLCPHELGGYLGSLLESFSSNLSNFRVDVEYPSLGINDSLNELKPGKGDLVLLDDMKLRAGRFKFLDLKSYGQRGHNAVRWNRFKSLNPIVCLIGCGDGWTSHERVNDPFPSDRVYRLACLAMARGILLAWPNLAWTNQLAREFFLKAN